MYYRTWKQAGIRNNIKENVLKEDTHGFNERKGRKLE